MIKTLRFGDIEVKSTALYVFYEGILGFKGLRKFVLLKHPDNDTFLWLQSCEEPAIALPLVAPLKCSAKFTKHVRKSNPEIIKNDLLCLVIVNIPDDPTLMTANLKAPLVLSKTWKTGRQVVLESRELGIREPVFSALAAKEKEGEGAINETLKLAQTL